MKLNFLLLKFAIKVENNGLSLYPRNKKLI